jgi:hypothetical protein
MERKAQHDHPLPKESQIYVKKTRVASMWAWECEPGSLWACEPGSVSLGACEPVSLGILLVKISFWTYNRGSGLLKYN